MISRQIAALKSIPGVEGILVFNNSGALLGRDLNDLYTSDLVMSLQRHMIHFFQGVDEYLGVYDDVLMRFQERAIYMRRSQDLLVFVIALPRCDADSLRMGSNLLLGQVQRLLAEPQAVKILTPRPPEVILVHKKHNGNSPFFNAPPIPVTNPLSQPVRPQTNTPPPRINKPKSDGIWG